jgi:hypothetical protein
MFSRVETFFMYFLPDLRVDVERLLFARSTWGISPRLYPHPGLGQSLKGGRYSSNIAMASGLPEWTHQDIYQMARLDTGIPLIVTGMKASDSNSRRRYLAWSEDDANIIHPVKDWNKHDVISYLKARGIPLPRTSGDQMFGVGLSIGSLLWVHDNYPDDFDKIERVFPYARAAVYQRDWFGATK